MKKEKRYFCDLMWGNEKFRAKEWIITILIIIGYFITIFSLGKYMANRENNSYPEEIYKYLETVSETIVKNGAFYPTLVPEDVEPSFTEKGDLELCYKSSDIKTVYIVKVTIKVSENFEIQSKTRNISRNEYNKKINTLMVGISGICTSGMIAVIIIFGTIISDFRKQRDKRK